VIDTDTSVRQRILELREDHPEWVKVLSAACIVAERIGPDAAFAGRWVLQEYAQTGGSPNKPGLRRLVAYGLIEPTGMTSRGGKRAYYKMRHREEIERVLTELGQMSR
jgi:hypothetical protein